MAYLFSALWRQSHPGAVRAWLGLSTLIGMTPYWAVGLTSLWLGLLCVLWEPIAQWWARQLGHRVWFVLPSPPGWSSRQLRSLGYVGPVASRLWEIHVQERRRWDGETPTAAAALFRVTFTHDLFRWIEARPAHVAVLLSTFNTLHPDEVVRLQGAHAWIGAGALHPRLAHLTDAHRMVATQRRMFGGVVSRRDRTNPATWTTVYIPPRITRGDELTAR